MDNVIIGIDNNLEKNFCDNLIEKFENAENKQPGCVGGRREKSRVNKSVKNTLDLLITIDKDWKNEDMILCESLKNGIKQYIYKITEKLDIKYSDIGIFSKPYKINDIGYQIQKYEYNKGFFNYHNDFVYSQKDGVRVITFIWYLNDVEEGGETEFINGRLIKPKKGSLLLFPSDWTYMHKGNMPLSSDKYICTGWLYINF